MQAVLNATTYNSEIICNMYFQHSIHHLLSQQATVHRRVQTNRYHCSELTVGCWHTAPDISLQLSTLSLAHHQPLSWRQLTHRQTTWRPHQHSDWRLVPPSAVVLPVIINETLSTLNRYRSSEDYVTRD